MFQYEYGNILIWSSDLYAFAALKALTDEILSDNEQLQSGKVLIQIRPEQALPSLLYMPCCNGDFDKHILISSERTLWMLKGLVSSHRFIHINCSQPVAEIKEQIKVGLGPASSKKFISENAMIRFTDIFAGMGKKKSI